MAYLVISVSDPDLNLTDPDPTIKKYGSGSDHKKYGSSSCIDLMFQFRENMVNYTCNIDVNCMISARFCNAN